MIDAPEKSIQFLEKLLAAEHSVVDKYVLLDELWQGLVVSEWSLSRLVSDTRQLLAVHCCDQEIIQTLRGKGFRIHLKVVIDKSLTSAIAPQSSSHADPTIWVKKFKISHYSFVVLVIVSVLITSILLLRQFDSGLPAGQSETTSSEIAATTSQDLLIVLPVQITTGDDQDNWVEYGVMTMVIEELQRFPDINVASMHSTLSNLAKVDVEYDQREIFEKVCSALGCNQLLLIDLSLSQESQPKLSYQLIRSNGSSTPSSFINQDVLEASNMLLEHLLQDLLPHSPERLFLSHTYTNNAVANQDYAIGVSRVYHGEFQSAKDYLNLALKREPTFTWAKIYKSEILYREGNLKAAEQLIDVLLKEALDIRQSIFLQNLLSNIAYSQGDLKRSIVIANHFLPAVEQTTDQDLLGATHMNIGTSYQALGDTKKALTHLKIALDTFQQHRLKLREAQVLLNLGNTIWVGNEDYELANQYYQQSAHIFRQLGAKNYVVYAKHMSAGIKVSTKRYAIAARELNEVAALYHGLGDIEGELMAQADLALIELKQQNLLQAEKIGLAVYKKSAAQFTYPRSIVSAYLAMTYLNLHQLGKAKLYIDERNKYDWFDPRPAFSMLPASYAHAAGDYQRAVDITEKLKLRLAEQWSDGHQVYANIFRHDLAINKSSIQDYANLSENISPP